jgi:hypothetical protein
MMSLDIGDKGEKTRFVDRGGGMAGLGIPV